MSSEPHGEKVSSAVAPPWRARLSRAIASSCPHNAFSSSKDRDDCARSALSRFSRATLLNCWSAYLRNTTSYASRLPGKSSGGWSRTTDRHHAHLVLILHPLPKLLIAATTSAISR
jgi:hypothetical protein